MDSSQLETIVQHTRMGIVVHRADTSIAMCNKAARELLGISDDAVLGLKADDRTWRLFREDGSPLPISEYPVIRVLESRQPIDNHVVGLSRLDGTGILWGLVNAVPDLDADGDVRQVIVSFVDITSRIESQRKLYVMSRAFSQTSAGLAVVDLSGYLQFLNPAFAEMHGYMPEELIGRNLSVFHTINQMPAVNEANRQIIEAGVFEGEIGHVHRDGHVFPGWMHNTLLKDDRGEPIGIIGTLHDITQLKLNEQELQQHRDHLDDLVKQRTHELMLANDSLRTEIDERRRIEEEARQLLENITHVAQLSTMGEMAAGVAHELNQPLGAIAAYAAAARRTLENDNVDNVETLRQLCESIQQQALRSGDIIRHLRRLVQRRTPEFKPCELSLLIDQVLELAQPDLKRLEIDVETEVDAALPLVCTDPVYFQQVLLNLINNAMDSMSAPAVADRKLKIAAVRHDGMVTVSTRDTGAGVSPGIQERLFDAFFTTKSEGMGMGLAICRSIIEAHRGRIWIEPNDASGLTVCFTMPIVEPT